MYASTANRVSASSAARSSRSLGLFGGASGARRCLCVGDRTFGLGQQRFLGLDVLVEGPQRLVDLGVAGPQRVDLGGNGGALLADLGPPRCGVAR